MKAREQKNISVRNALKRYGLFVYDLERILDLSETSITRMMRRELPQDEQDRIISLIEKEANKNAD